MLDRIYTGLHMQDLDLWAALDILILGLIIYQLLLLIRGTRSVNVVVAIIVLAVLYLLTGGLIKLTAVHAALGSLLIYIPLVIIVLFQNQIRQALANLGTNPLSSLWTKHLEADMIEEVTLAAASLASKRLGSLIVIERGMGLRSFSETGIRLDAVISYDLLMNIFTRRSPLHDGAVMIAERRIQAAASYLPLTVDPSLSRKYGTRHRAAIGLTEESDALVIVTSEERGVLSLAMAGKIIEDLDARGLSEILQRELLPKTVRKETVAEERVVAAGPTDA
jgi:diadenylate cyclase